MYYMSTRLVSNIASLHNHRGQSPSLLLLIVSNSSSNRLTMASSFLPFLFVLLLPLENVHNSLWHYQGTWCLLRGWNLLLMLALRRVDDRIRLVLLASESYSTPYQRGCVLPRSFVMVAGRPVKYGSCLFLVHLSSVILPLSSVIFFPHHSLPLSQTEPNQEFLSGWRFSSLY